MTRTTSRTPLLPAERKAIFSLASIFSLRMFGLFMLLPVLAIYADDLSDTTPLLIGLAMGVYGLTQAIFQLPLGLLSDRVRRKHVIAGGLLVFALGSVIAALSDSIYGLIAGRAIQGVGAVSAAVLALTSDLTRNEQRTKAMAIIGISIGFTFLMSLILAPVLQNYIGVDGLFWLISVLAIVAILVVYKVVPDPICIDASKVTQEAAVSIKQQINSVITSRQLMQLNLGIMVLHLVLTAMFIVLPNILIENSQMALSEHWKIYTPVLLLSVIGMAPFVRAGSNHQSITLAFRIAICLLLLSLIFQLIGAGSGLMWWLFTLVLFFSAFNALESLLPSLVSQLAPAEGKGTAMGIYNTFQFSGIFIGGITGGLISGHFGSKGVFLLCAIAVFSWLVYSMISGKLLLPAPKLAESGGRKSI